MKSTCRENLNPEADIEITFRPFAGCRFLQNKKPKAGKALLQGNIDKLFTINALKLRKQNMTNTPLLMAESGQPFDDMFTPFLVIICGT